MSEHSPLATFLDVGRELTAIASGLARNVRIRNAESPAPESARSHDARKKIIVFGTGFLSPESIYAQFARSLKKRGYHLHIARSLLRYGITVPHVPTAIAEFEKEVLDIGRADADIYLAGYSLGGILAARIFAEQTVRSRVLKVVLLGAPFNESAVWPFLKRLALNLCGISEGPIPTEFIPIAEFILNTDDKTLARMLSLNMRDDRLAPKNTGTLPRILVGSPRATHQSYFHNSHTGCMFDPSIPRTIATYFNAPEMPYGELQPLLTERHPELSFEISQRQLTEAANLFFS